MTDRVIAYMEIDIDGKNRKDLEDEVVTKVREMIAKKKAEVQNGQFLMNTEFLVAQLVKEEENIIKQFLVQIENSDSIEN